MLVEYFRVWVFGFVTEDRVVEERRYFLQKLLLCPKIDFLAVGRLNGSLRKPLTSPHNEEAASQHNLVQNGGETNQTVGPVSIHHNPSIIFTHQKESS